MIHDQALRSLSSRLLRCALFLVLGASTSLAACNGKELDGGSRHVMFVRQALAPPADRSNGACTYTNDANAPALLTGTLDLGLRDDYTLNVLVQSSDNAVSTNVSSSHITVRTPDGTRINEFTQPIAGFIEAGGRGVVRVIGIDAPTRELLLAGLDNRAATRTVVVHVDLAGTDPTNGSSVSSPEYAFPVTVCNGCLVSFATGYDPAAPTQPNCLLPPAADLRMPCYVGQDEIVPCELCATSRMVCNPFTP